jgi:hypothetical protein
MSNHQAYRDVEANRDLSAFNRRPPTIFGVQRGAHTLERASSTIKVPRHANVIREPSVSHLATSPIPLASGSPITSISPVTAQDPLLPSHSGPASGACPDQRPLNEDSNKPTSSAGDQLALPTTAQRTNASLKDHRSPFAQAFGHITSLFSTTVSPAKLITVIETGDTLVRGDTVPFLTDQLPL